MCQRIKRNILAVLLVGALLLPAGAVSYSGERFELEIPTEGKSYYYSSQGTNMTGTMLANAQKQEMLLLIGSYSEAGTLRYTFKAEEMAGEGETVAWDLQTTLAGAYDLSSPVEDAVAGQNGWSLWGQSVQNSNYLARVFITGAEPCLVLTTMYQADAEPELEQLLRSIQWPLDPSMERDPDAVPLPGATAEPEEDDTWVEVPETFEPQPLEPIPADEVEQGGVLARLLSQAEVFLERDLWLVVAVAGVGVAVVLLLLLRLSRRQKPRKAKKGKGYAPKHAKR